MSRNHLATSLLLLLISNSGLAQNIAPFTRANSILCKTPDKDLVCLRTTAPSKECLAKQLYQPAADLLSNNQITYDASSDRYIVSKYLMKLVINLTHEERDLLECRTAVYVDEATKLVNQKWIFFDMHVHRYIVDPAFMKGTLDYIREEQKNQAASQGGSSGNPTPSGECHDGGTLN